MIIKGDVPASVVISWLAEAVDRFGDFTILMHMGEETFIFTNVPEVVKVGQREWALPEFSVN